MNFAELTSKVKRDHNIDVQHALARYQSLAPNPTVDSFLIYLRDQRVIDNNVFTALLTGDAVDTTNVDPSTVGALVFRATNYAGDTKATKMSSSPPTAGVAADANTRVEGNGQQHHAQASQPPPAEQAQYAVLGELGKGAMGEVHVARDLVLRRKVALKSILPAMQENPALFSRFLGEMQITAQLDHPFIVPVYGVENGPSGGLAYAMKLVQGKEFGVLLDETRELLNQNKPLDDTHSLDGRLEAFLKVCDAMAYAHERGVVHRDLKPANIMIGRFNEVYVMDWGIARLIKKGSEKLSQAVEMYDADGADARSTTRTRVGSTIGTPIYMSPEQALGKNDELDGRSDLYSLGLILQEIVTLTGAVGGTTLEEVLTNAKGGRRLVVRPPTPGTEVPRAIRAIIDKATRLNPDERYPTVTHFADDIRRFLRNEEVLARPDTGMERAGRWVSKHRMAAISLFLGALVLGAGAAIGLLLYNKSVTATQQNRELRLAELQASSAQRAEDLDAVLQHYETELTRMAGAATMAVHMHAETIDDKPTPIHFSDDFKAGSTTVPDLAPSKFYGAPVSFEWPVASIAPGLSKEDAAKEVDALEGLRVLARAVMLESLDPAFHLMPAEDQKKALLDTGVPISRITLTLENGLHLEYPGKAGLAPDHDGREDQPYKDAADEHELVWSDPIKTADGSVVLPVSAPLWDERGEFIGVLTFEVDTDRSVSSALEPGESQYVESSLLLESSGKILAQKNGQGVAAEGDTFAMKDVREAMDRGERGYLQTQRSGRDVLVTYQPLSTVGWYLVTIANLDKLKSTATKDGSRPGSVVAAPPPSAKPVAAPPPKPKPTAAPPKPAPLPPPSAEPSASASAVASEEPPPVPAPNGTYSLPPVKKTTDPAPTAPPPNPFDPWKAYDKDKK